MSRILKAFLENEAAIRRFLKRNFHSGQDVEDELQDTFLRGFAAEMKYEIEEPKSYLFQIARHVAIDRLREKQRGAPSAYEDLDEVAVLIDEAQISPDDGLDSRRKLAVLARAVAELPPQCRRAFAMRRIDGMAFKDIALEMNISVSAVEKYVASGLARCNAYLRRAGYEPEEFGAPANEQEIKLPERPRKKRTADCDE